MCGHKIYRHTDGLSPKVHVSMDYLEATGPEMAMEIVGRSTVANDNEVR